MSTVPAKTNTVQKAVYHVVCYACATRPTVPPGEGSRVCVSVEPYLNAQLKSDNKSK